VDRTAHMRILYLHQYFATPAMVGGTRSYEMARRLVACGHDVQMITSDRSTPDRSGWRESKEAGIHVHWLSVPYSNRMGHTRRLGAFANFALRASRRAVEVGGDLVFATSTPLTIALPATRIKRRLGIPMVFEVRDLWPTLPIAVGALRSGAAIWAARWLERHAYSNAQHIIALSPGMKAGIVETGIIPEAVTVVPNSCDLEAFNIRAEATLALRQGFEWLGSRQLVLYAGTLGMINGVEYLAKIAAETISFDPEVRFVVVGSGLEEEKVRRIADDLGVLERNFFMLPSLPKAAVAAWFAAADLSTSLCVDLPELWSNSANKFFDALAAGTPVMINYEGWQADLLRDSRAGIVVPPDEPRRAAAEVVDFLGDRERRQAAEAAAAKLAREEFGRDMLFDRFRCVLETAVGGR
jgi:glycosyltransferase involved in cell wall biosynthesis